MTQLERAVNHLRMVGYQVIHTPSGYLISTATGELQTVASERLQSMARAEGMRA
jgi:biotin operon repressor